MFCVSVTLVYYASVPLFVSRISRDALPDEIIRRYKSRAKRTWWPRRSKAIRIVEAQQALAALKAVMPPGAVREEVDRAIWEVLDEALAVPKSAADAWAMKYIAEAIVKELLSDTQRAGPDALALARFAERLQDENRLSTLAAMDLCRTSLWWALSSIATRTAALDPDTSAAAVRAATDLMSHAVRAASVAPDTDPVHTEPNSRRDAATTVYGQSSSITGWLEESAHLASRLFELSPGTLHAGGLATAICDLIVEPTRSAPAITELPTKPLLDALVDMFAQLLRPARGLAGMHPAQREARLNYVVDVTIRMLESAQGRGALHLAEGRLTLSALLGMSRKAIALDDTEVASRIESRIRDWYPRAGGGDSRCSASDRIVVRRLLEAGARDIAVTDAYLLSRGGQITDSAFLDPCWWLFHDEPTSVGVAARFLEALDSELMESSLNRGPDAPGEIHGLLLWDSPNKPMGPFRADVQLRVILFRWARAAGKDYSRIKTDFRAGAETLGPVSWTPTEDPDQQIRRLATREALEDSLRLADSSAPRSGLAGLALRRWMESARAWLHATEGDAVVDITAFTAATKQNLDPFLQVRTGLLRAACGPGATPDRHGDDGVEWHGVFGWNRSWAAAPDPAPHRIYHFVPRGEAVTLVVQEDDRSAWVLPREYKLVKREAALTDQHTDLDFPLYWDSKSDQNFPATGADLLPLLLTEVLGPYGVCRTCLGASVPRLYPISCPSCLGTGAFQGAEMRSLEHALWVFLYAAIWSPAERSLLPCRFTLQELRYAVAEALPEAEDAEGYEGEVVPDGE